MNRVEFMKHVRIFTNDSEQSNIIIRENVRARPGNVFDGNNLTFRLLNCRIVAASLSLYNEDNAPIPPASFSLISVTGVINFVLPPSVPFFADYSWHRLIDEELEAVVLNAASSGDLNPDNIEEKQLDFATKYAAAFYWLRVSASAADYYTLTVGGKQVSKSELFNHYRDLYKMFLDDALRARGDMITKRGKRELLTHETSTPASIDPYGDLPPEDFW